MTTTRPTTCEDCGEPFTGAEPVECEAFLSSANPYPDTLYLCEECAAEHGTAVAAQLREYEESAHV